MDCIFCKIVAGEIPGNILYKDDKIIAFRDINPQAPTHLLIIPREHIVSLAHLSEAETPIIGHMVKIANRLAKQEGVFKSGYRLVINSGKQSGQLVPHLHLHLLGGRNLSGIMG